MAAPASPEVPPVAGSAGASLAVGEGRGLSGPLCGQGLGGQEAEG